MASVLPLACSSPLVMLHGRDNFWWMLPFWVMQLRVTLPPWSVCTTPQRCIPFVVVSYQCLTFPGHSLHARHWAKLFTQFFLLPFNSPDTVWNGYYYCTHLIDEEIREVTERLSESFSKCVMFQNAIADFHWRSPKGRFIPNLLVVNP